MRAPSTCPKCGRVLRIANQEHVCGAYELEPHFEGRDPLGRIAFNWICESLDPLGGYSVLPMKTTIAFINGVNLAFVKTKKKGAEISLVIDQATDSRLQFVMTYSRAKAIYRVPIASEDDLDTSLCAELVKAYRMTI